MSHQKSVRMIQIKWEPQPLPLFVHQEILESRLMGGSEKESTSTNKELFFCFIAIFPAKSLDGVIKSSSSSFAAFTEDYKASETIIDEWVESRKSLMKVNKRKWLWSNGFTYESNLWLTTSLFLARPFDSLRSPLIAETFSFLCITTSFVSYVFKL